MKILFALTYYRPHISGLTVHAQRLAEALAARGHDVTVLASRHDARLPLTEMLDGVRVVRVPVKFRLGKGPVMPSYSALASTLLREHDLVVLNLPATPAESVVLPILTCLRKARLPIVAIYYCDVRLPPGLFNRVADGVVFLSNAAACALANRIVSLTDDYAAHSPLLRHFIDKYETISPSVVIESPSVEASGSFRHRHAPHGERLVGMAARFAAEKGIEYLLEALPRIRAEVGVVKILFTGDPRHVVGEEHYRRLMQQPLARAGDACVFLGTLDARELATFYGACDVTVLPSTNSTEAFGLVQLESMLCGTPVVASDLPGVRVPVRTTGMGRLAAPRDAHALADALVEVIKRRARYVRPRAEVERHFSFAAMVDEYEALFRRLLRQTGGGDSATKMARRRRAENV